MVHEKGNRVLSTGVVLLILALLLVIAGANTIGELSANPRFGLEEVGRPDIGSATPAEPEPPPQADGKEAPAATVPTQLLLIISITLLLIGIALLVRSAVRNRFVEPEKRFSSGSAGPDMAAELAEDQLQALRGHFDDALTALEHHGGDPDAMIRCWLALERAALIAGGGRKLHQTPTEFTTAVLTRFHTDPADTDVVLRLYQRTRFAVHTEQASITKAELARAQEALESMRADIERNLPAPKAGL